MVMALGVLLQCHSSWPVAAVSLHTAAAAVSVLAAAAAIAAAATRDASASLSAATMSLGSDSLGLQAWLCRLSCKARRIGHSEMVDHEYVVFVCAGRRPDYIGTKPGWSTIREDWFLNGW